MPPKALASLISTSVFLADERQDVTAVGFKQQRRVYVSPLVDHEGTTTSSLSERLHKAVPGKEVDNERSPKESSGFGSP